VFFHEGLWGRDELCIAWFVDKKLLYGPQDHFCQTPTEAAGGAVPAPLRERPGDTPVMMYCTGGIRCDIYSTYLRQKARPLPRAS
jgi:hypothetical protein